MANLHNQILPNVALGIFDHSVPLSNIRKNVAIPIRRWKRFYLDFLFDSINNALVCYLDWLKIKNIVNQFRGFLFLNFSNKFNGILKFFYFRFPIGIELFPIHILQNGITFMH